MNGQSREHAKDGKNATTRTRHPGRTAIPAPPRATYPPKDVVPAVALGNDAHPAHVRRGRPRLLGGQVDGVDAPRQARHHKWRQHTRRAAAAAPAVRSIAAVVAASRGRRDAAHEEHALPRRPVQPRRHLVGRGGGAPRAFALGAAPHGRHHTPPGGEAAGAWRGGDWDGPRGRSPQAAKREGGDGGGEMVAGAGGGGGRCCGSRCGCFPGGGRRAAALYSGHAASARGRGCTLGGRAGGSRLRQRRSRAPNTNASVIRAEPTTPGPPCRRADDVTELQFFLPDMLRPSTEIESGFQRSIVRPKYAHVLLFGGP